MGPKRSFLGFSLTFFDFLHTEVNNVLLLTQTACSVKFSFPNQEPKRESKRVTWGVFWIFLQNSSADFVYFWLTNREELWHHFAANCLFIPFFILELWSKKGVKIGQNMTISDFSQEVPEGFFFLIQSSGYMKIWQNPDIGYIWDFIAFSDYWVYTEPKTVFCPSPTLGELFL